MKEEMTAFIQKQKTAFVASVDEEGFPNIKAMFMPRKIEGNCFYFSTNTSSMRAQQFLKNEKASIYFYQRSRYRYEGLMLTGKMEVLQDPETQALHHRDVKSSAPHTGSQGITSLIAKSRGIRSLSRPHAVQHDQKHSLCHLLTISFLY